MFNGGFFLPAPGAGKARKYQLKKELQVAFDVQKSQREKGGIHRAIIVVDS
jgi:hypothetical protein